MLEKSIGDVEFVRLDKDSGHYPDVKTLLMELHVRDIEAANPIFYAAIAGNHVVGAARMTMDPDIEQIGLKPNPYTIYRAEGMHVLPEYRKSSGYLLHDGLSIGEALLHLRVEDAFAMGADAVVALARKQSIAGAYQRAGFHIMSEVEADGLDKCIMIGFNPANPVSIWNDMLSYRKMPEFRVKIYNNLKF